MNMMTLGEYNAKIDYDADLDMFRGEILGLNGGADFYGRNPKELRAEFNKSLQVFIEVCQEKGIEARRNYSGRFNLRIPPELHEKLAIVAQAAMSNRRKPCANGRGTAALAGWLKKG